MRRSRAAVHPILLLTTCLAWGAQPASDPTVVRTHGRGGPWLHLEDGRTVPVRLPEESRAVRARGDRSARPLSLASNDFDEDGVPDLVAAFASGQGGFLSIHRGNVDATHVNAPEARARRAAGRAVEAAFLPEARAIDTAEPADFLVAGDFDADGHQDLVAAALGGETLTLYSGDGTGGFATGRPLALPGRVTALVAGETNRPDGLADIVVGIEEPRGAAVLVFEGPGGAFRAEPERIPLPEPAIDLAVLEPQLDAIANDLAIGTSHDVVVVHGRDRRDSYPAEERRQAGEAIVERVSLPYVLEAMAAGSFRGERQPALALLDESGAVHVVVAKNLKDAAGPSGPDPEPLPRRAEILAKEPRTEETATSQATESAPRASASPRAPRGRRLTAARLSGLPGEDLLVLDRPGGALHVRTPRAAWVTFDAPATTVAALPMRLNADALADLAVLSEGTASLSTVTSGPATTFVVTNTNPTGPGSLRQAIAGANGSPGADAIEFAIPGAGPHVIHPDMLLGLGTVTEAVSIDGTTEPGYAGTPVIVIDSAVVGSTVGLYVQAGGTAVRGLTISHSASDGLVLDGAGSSLVEGCFFGTDATGTTAAGNSGFGINVVGSTFVTIGGTTAAAGNLISGNLAGGIRIGDLSHAALVQGNRIGVDRDGGAPLPNFYFGIDVVNSNNVTVGGVSAGSGNVISGNTHSGLFTDIHSSGVLVQGNLIGTDAAGMADIGNDSFGIDIAGPSNTIGGTTTGAGNVVAGSRTAPDGTGIRLGGVTTGGNLVQGNLIGTNRTGTAALPNLIGVYVLTPDNLIGGIVAGARNVISGNDSDGILIRFSADANRVFGNFIGTTLSGAAPLGNRFYGIEARGISGTRVGGPGALANVISGHPAAGVVFVGVADSLVEVNFIGTDASGAAAIPNGSGIGVFNSTSPNQIGVRLGQGNIISGNRFEGIFTQDTSNLKVQGNIIGLDAAGDAPIPNGTGVAIWRASGNLVGGGAPDEGNIISGNATDGVTIESESSSNRFQNNRIGLRRAGDAARPNGRHGVFIPGVSSGAPANIIGEAGAGNTISGNFGNGIRIDASDDTVVIGNAIGTDVARSFAIGNVLDGILVSDSDRTVIGGPVPGKGNLIAFNGGSGVTLASPARAGNTVRSNSIFFNNLLGIDLIDVGPGVSLNDPDDADLGTNHLQNFPEINSVTTTGGSLTVNGRLDGTPLSDFTLDFYSSPTCDPTGHGEGQTWLGSVPASTGPGSADALFLSSLFGPPVSAGETVTATATSADGSTSEFSSCIAATGVPPAAVTGLMLDGKTPGTVFWDPGPGSFEYHAYIGTRATLPGLLTQAVDSCTAGTVPGTVLPIPSNSQDPPPGQMIWINITAEGPYGEGPLQPSSAGPRILNSAGACGQSCAHNPCQTGTALQPACTLCASIICESDPTCCDPVNGAWTAPCAKKMLTVCGSLSCPDSQGQCAHSVCAPGGPLVSGCDTPPLPVSCTARICQADPHCCQQAWDDACLAKVSPVCGFNCL